MEKVIGYWYCYLLTYDKNPISAEEADCKNRISEEKIKIIWVEVKIIKISSRNLEKTAFNLVRKNDPNLWIKLTTKIPTNWSHEIRNRKPWRNNELAHRETKKIAANVQKKVFLPEKKRATRQRREKNSRRLHKSYITRQKIYWWRF